MNDIFSLDKFNIYSDQENYYFFRALNLGDESDLEKGIILDENNNIKLIRTDLDRYLEEAIYTKNDSISLEQMVDHIKMNHRYDTNCISITSNANTAITYGRASYKDRYIMLTIPKSSINKDVYEAGLYLLVEIDKRIKKEYDNLSYEQQEYINRINNAKTQEELNLIKLEIFKNVESKKNNDYQNGLDFTITQTEYYRALNEQQNLIKNKIVLQMDILNKPIIKSISNKNLIQTIGNAFSSLELIHYKEIKEEKITYLPKGIIDILGIIQQLPKNLNNLEELKEEFISKIKNIKVNTEFAYENASLEEDIFTLEQMYKLTEGRVDYKSAFNMYKKTFYLCKSKLRNLYSIELLKKVINNNPKYNEIIEYMQKNTYGIEPEIATRISNSLVNISESISLDFKNSERKLFDFINNLDIKIIKKNMENPLVALKIILNELMDKNDFCLQLSKEEWYANSIIDMLDLTRLNIVENLSLEQRKDIINKLIDYDFINKFKEIKTLGYDNKTTANLLFTQLIRKSKDVSKKELFTLEELEDFIGYNKIKNTRFILKPYQRITVDEIDNIFQKRKFATAILPTGAGKSFVALAEMYQYRDEEILYLAPNIEILDQIKKYIRLFYKPEEHLSENIDNIIKRKFPHLTFATYQSLKENSSEEIINKKYSMIVFDELHRTGAKEWIKNIHTLIDNQKDEVKVLGITATPQRDVDLKNMDKYWAYRLGYTQDEIEMKKYEAINIDIIETIKYGYICHPKVVCCEYSLIQDGTYDEINYEINELSDSNLKDNLSLKYENSRRNVEKSSGIEKVLRENLEEEGKYIVFLPVSRNKNGVYEDEDGNQISKSEASKVVKDYQTLMNQYLYSQDYFDKNENIILEIYNKIKEKKSLDEIDKEFLMQEKNNILLLSNIDIAFKYNAMNTKNQRIIDTIITTMNWQRLSNKEIQRELAKKMQNKVENLSMLGSYSISKNRQNLASFNLKTNGKKKFMFVMNKLNEGVHIDNVTGIIWLRPIDKNSKILYLQQLGRCLFTIQNNDYKRPIVIDLVNNTLKVNFEKGMLDIDKDIIKLLNIRQWIKINQRIPNKNSNNKIEKKQAEELNCINKKYAKYIDENLIMTLSKEDIYKIKRIIELGLKIDLWSMPTWKNEDIKKNIHSNDTLIDFFEIKGITKDFLDLKNNVDDICVNINVLTWVKELINYCETTGEWPKYDVETKVGEKTSNQLAKWLNASGYNNKCFKYSNITIDGKKIIEIIDNLYKRYGRIKQGSSESILIFIKELIKYCETTGEWPKYDSAIKVPNGIKTSNQLATWIQTSGYNNKCFKYNNINIDDKPVIKIIDELYNKYGNSKRGTNERIINYVQELKKYCEIKGEWPKSCNNNKPSECEKSSNQLAQWLRKSGYYKNKFKYKNTILNGISIIEIINDLYCKYNSEIIKYEQITNYVQELKKYCEITGEWPKSGNHNKPSECEKTSRQLAQWLSNSGYINGNFKYKDISIDGKTIIEIIDELSKKYKKTKKIKG